MPIKERTYDSVIFTPEVIKEAVGKLEAILPQKGKMDYQRLTIRISPEEKQTHDSEEEFFADYLKGFKEASFNKFYEGGEIRLLVYENNSSVTVFLPHRADVEKVFNTLESNVEKCRLPRQPQRESKIKTDWIAETINKVGSRCPIAGRKLKLALLKLDSGDAEEWQNATMLIRDAWIELTQWLCQVNNIDTSDVSPDAVIDRLKKLKVDKTDEKLFNLARASFNLHGKHHKRNIDNDAAVACVISTVVSMQTVIREVF